MSPNDLIDPSNIFGVEYKCLDCDVYSFQILLSLHMGTIIIVYIFITRGCATHDTVNCVCPNKYLLSA